MSVSQSPCDFTRTYSAFVDESSSLPDFLSLTDDGYLVFDDIKENQAGEYSITVKSEIGTQQTPPAFVLGNLLVRVIVREKAIVLTPKEVKFNIENLAITVGTPFLYELPDIYDYNGRLMSLEVDLGSA